MQGSARLKAGAQAIGPRPSGFAGAAARGDEDAKAAWHTAGRPLIGGLMSASYAIIRPGDILRRPKGLHEHVGVAWFDGRVLHNSPRRGEHLSSVDEFAAGRAVRVQPTPTHYRSRVLANGAAVLRAPAATISCAIIANIPPTMWCMGDRRARSSWPGR